MCVCVCVCEGVCEWGVGANDIATLEMEKENAELIMLINEAYREM